MKKISKMALAGALVVSINGAALVSPAFAKKKEEASNAPTISKEVRDNFIAAKAALDATPKDLPKAEVSITALDAAAKSDYEKYIATSLRLALVSAQSASQTDAQRAAALAPLLDALIANPATPKNEVAIRTNERAGLYFTQKQYAQAAAGYQKAKDLGYTDSDLLLNMARSKVEAGDVEGGVAALDQAVKVEEAAGRVPPEAWYKYAFTRLYKAGKDEAGDAWTAGWLSHYGTKQNWRAAIYTFGFQGPNAAKYSKNRVDLFRLMWATKSQAGQTEYLQYADSALKVGLPNEAKVVLDEGMASNAVPATNVLGKELAGLAKTGIAGSTPAATKEKNAQAAAKGDLAGQAGDAYFGSRNYTKAVEMYRLAESKGPTDADRNSLHLGMALALSGDKEGAKAALAKVASEPNKSIARLWQTYVAAPPAA